MRLARMTAAASVLLLAIAAPPRSRAHCDTLDGPVVMDARRALQARQVDPVLKPAGTPLDPAVAAADQALETASPDALVRLISTEVDHGLRERFARALAARRQATESVALGRAYVAAYIEFVHYAERLRLNAGSSAGHDDMAHTDREH